MQGKMHQPKGFANTREALNVNFTGGLWPIGACLLGWMLHRTTTPRTRSEGIGGRRLGLCCDRAIGQKRPSSRSLLS